MAIYDIDGNEIKSTGSFDSAVSVKPVDVGGNVIIEFNGDGLYYYNPFTASATNTTWILYDENKEPIPIYNSNNEVVNRMDLSGSSKGSWNIQQRNVMEFNGTTITLKTYISYEALVAGNNSGSSTYHTNVIPSYMKVAGRWTYNIYSDESIEEGLYQVEYNNEKYIGFFEQIDDYVQKNMGDSVLNRTTEFGQKFVQESVYQINQTRDALRIGTFNIYSAGHAQSNWACIKNELQDFGLDICAFQEVRDPLNTVGTNKVWADEMTGWQFPYASTNGELYPVNERVALSKYPIVSSSEQQFEVNGTDNRFLAKYEIQLPAHQDRVGSDRLKMSVYNTQLEVGSKEARVSECEEMLDIIALDTNPFIVICMDSNDFTVDKVIWQMIEEAGFTRCIDARSQTVRDQNDIIDQIFVNSNMKSLNCDVINSKRYKFLKGNAENAVSDHDLCFADIQLLYDDFVCVSQTLTHVTSDYDLLTADKGEPLTIHFTAEQGYTLSSASIKMGSAFISSLETASYENGVLTIEEVTGDLNIKVTATER